MNQGIGEIVLLVGKTTIVLALALAIYVLLRNANPRWQVQACRLTGLVLLICGLLSGMSLSNVWGPSLTQNGHLFTVVENGRHSANTQDLVGSNLAREFAGSELFNESEPVVGQSDSNLEDCSVAATPTYGAISMSEVDSLGLSAMVSMEADVGVQQISPLFSPKEKSVVGSASAWLMLFVWGAVAFCLASLRLLASYQVRCIVARSSPIPTAIASACSAVTLRVRISKDVSSPTVVGCWRPTILLPAWMDHDGEHAQSDLRAACAHEQAHVANSDLIWIHLLEWLTIGLWFQPLLYVLKALHRTACERVADSNAATCVGDAKHYAACLARVALKVFERPIAGSKLVAMISMVTPASRQRSSSIAKRLNWVRESRPVERLGQRRFGIALGTIVAAFAIGTLGLVESPLGAAPPGVETQEVNSTADSNEQNVPIVPNGPQQNIQLTTLTQEPIEQERPGQLSERRTSVYNAIVSAPRFVPKEVEPLCVLSITGVVRDESGRVQPDVHVALIASLNRVGKGRNPLNPIVAHITTDANGVYSFNDIESVMDYQVAADEREYWWRIVAVAPDGRIGWENVQSVSPSASIEQDVVLTQSTFIEAHLVDEQAQPVDGASIQATYWAQASEYEESNDVGLSAQEHGVYLNELPLKTQTDANGWFGFDGLPMDAIVSFTIRHPSIADKLVLFATTDGPRKVELLAPPSLSKRSGDVIDCEAGTLVHGKVVDESGQGLKASVTIHGAGSRVLAFAETQNGEFSLRVPQGDDLEKLFGIFPSVPHAYTVLVHPDDEESYSATTYELAVAELETASPVNLALWRRFEFSGRVVDTAGHGIAGVGILARSTEGPVVPSEQYRKTEPAQTLGRATTDEQGKFKVRLAEGDVDFLLSGRLPGVDLVQYERFVDENGHLWRWPEGLKSTHIVHVQATQRQLSPLVVRKTEPIKVRVVGPTGAPIAGAQVTMLASPGITGAKKASLYLRQMVPIAEQVTTDDDGRCCLVPCALPDYTAAIKVVSNESSRPALAEFRFERILNVEEELRRGLVITTQPALHISGRITVEGEPLDKIWINVGKTMSRLGDVADSNGHHSQMPRTNFNNQGGLPNHVRTNAAGVYEAWVEAKQAHWGVSLNAGFPNDYRGFPIHEVKYADPLHARVDIDLKRGTHTLSGKVVDQAGNPIPMARVRMQANASIDPATLYEATIVTTGFNGTFRISGLPVADAYSLYAEVRPQEQGTRPVKSEIVTVSPEGNVTIIVNLAP